MDKILNLNNVDLYNQIYGLETLHPLVTVIDLNKATAAIANAVRTAAAFLVFLMCHPPF